MSDLSGNALVAQTLAAAGGSDGKAKGKGALVPTLAAVAILTVVALAGGAGVGWLLGGETAESPPKPDAAAAAPTEAEKLDAVLRLKPLVTNISTPSTVVVRMQGSVVARAADVPDPDVLAAQIEGDTLAFLRTLDLAQIEGSRGLLHLREDLVERAKVRSPAVSDYLIESLVVQ